jgi:hypothetical protein
VCGAAVNTSLVPRFPTPSERNRDIDVTYDGAPGAYEVTFHPDDWRPLDTFDLIVRHGVPDASCSDEVVVGATAIRVTACHPDGWPTASTCRSEPAVTLDQGDCKNMQSAEATALQFVCGKAVAEGTMPGQPAPKNPYDPELGELKAHTYQLTAYQSGIYQVILDGSKQRTATIGAADTLVAEKSCTANVACESLGSLVQLDIGTTCGDNDVVSLSDFTAGCVIELGLVLTQGDVRYLTVRPDVASGCGPAKDQSCDYNYALWVRGPDGN